MRAFIHAHVPCCVASVSDSIPFLRPSRPGRLQLFPDRQAEGSLSTCLTRQTPSYIHLHRMTMCDQFRIRNVDETTRGITKSDVLLRHHGSYRSPTTPSLSFHPLPYPLHLPIVPLQLHPSPPRPCQRPRPPFYRQPPRPPCLLITIRSPSSSTSLASSASSSSLLFSAWISSCSLSCCQTL